MSTKQIRPTYPPAPGEDDTFQPAFFSVAASRPARTKRPPAFLWFTAKFPVTMAISIFRKKHNCTPARIGVEGTYLKVGPIPEEMTA